MKEFNAKNLHMNYVVYVKMRNIIPFQKDIWKFHVQNEMKIISRFVTKS